MAFSWDRCIICQEEGNSPLRCPLNANTSINEKHGVFENFIENVRQFEDCDLLPIKLSEEVLSANSNVLVENRANWHKTCRLKFTVSKLEKAKEFNEKKRLREVDEGTSKRNSKRRSCGDQNAGVCMFCNDFSTESLHVFTSLVVDKNIRSMAEELEDFDLLSRLSTGDLISMGGQYHMTCLTSFRNRYRSLKRKEADEDKECMEEVIYETRAFMELTTYISKSVEEGTLLFKLSELHSLYEDRLKDLGVPKQVNKTRLKTSLLSHFSDAQEQNDGKHIIIAFKQGMKKLIKDALSKQETSDETSILTKAATIVRNDILNHEGFNFSGCFHLECQERSIPSSLKSLISMILNGPSLKVQENNDSQACLTVSQTIVFNTKKRPSSSSTAKPRHVFPREPPLPLYIGLNIHSHTRNKTFISKLHQLGLSVSYDRILEIEDWLAKSVSERFKEDGCVCPANLKNGLFSVAALDNLDHNPSSTTASSSFHGTSISIFQFPTESSPGEERAPLKIPPATEQKHCLPESYSRVPPVSLTPNTVSIPLSNPSSILSSTLDAAIACENSWLEYE